MAHVLMVDDDDDIRETLGFLLDGEGHTVIAAASGQDALALLRATPGGHVVVLDYLMPGMSGEGVLNTALADPALVSRLAFVVMTAASSHLPASFVSTLTARHIPLVKKPFDLEQLIGTVERAAVCVEEGRSWWGAADGGNDMTGS